MKKITIVVLCLSAIFVLAACNVRIELPDIDPKPVAFEGKTGTILETTYNISSPDLEIGFQVMFKRTSGNLTVRVTSPEGQVVKDEPLKATIDIPQNITDDEKLDWGAYSFKHVAKEVGNYRIELIGSSASGKLQYIPSDFIQFGALTGTVATLDITAKTPDDYIGFSVSSAHKAGILTVKVLSPSGQTVTTSRLQEEEGIFTYREKAGQEGTFKLVIEADKASGVVGVRCFTQTSVPSVAFIRPILTLLLGLIAIFLISRGNRRIMFWGCFLWFAAYIVGGFAMSYMQRWLTTVFLGPDRFIWPVVIPAGIMGFLQGISITFINTIRETQGMKPMELVGLAVGFVVIEPIMAGVSGFTTIFNLSNSSLPFPTIYPIPGNYPSASVAAYDIVVPFLMRAFSMISTIAVIILIIWVIRRRGNPLPIPNWLIIVLACLAKFVIELLIGYTNILPILGERSAAYWEALPIGSPMNQGLIILGILFLSALVVYLAKNKIKTMTQESCPVMLDVK